MIDDRTISRHERVKFSQASFSCPNRAYSRASIERGPRRIAGVVGKIACKRNVSEVKTNARPTEVSRKS